MIVKVLRIHRTVVICSYGSLVDEVPPVLPDASSLFLDSPMIAARILKKSVRNALAVTYRIASVSREAFSCHVSLMVISEYSAVSYSCNKFCRCSVKQLGKKSGKNL